MQGTVLDAEGARASSGGLTPRVPEADTGSYIVKSNRKLSETSQNSA